MNGADALVIIALGTAGDVVPLHSLARLVAEVRSDTQIVFITHAELVNRLTNQSTSICVRGIASACLRRPVRSTDRVDRAQSTNGEVEAAADERSATARRQTEMMAILAALPERVDMIVSNLFATVAAHIAEYVSAPLVIASPYFIPYESPANLGVRFDARLVEHLQSRPTAGGARAETAWSDVRHWMWSPMLDSAQRTFRDRTLRLCAQPLLAELEAYGRLPPPPPVLYGLPSILYTMPPQCAHSALVGFWTPPPLNAVDIVAIEQRHARLCAFLGSTVPAPAGPATLLSHTASLALTSAWPCAFVGFGSMGAIGLLAQPARVLSAILSVLARAHLRAVVVRSSFCALDGCNANDTGDHGDGDHDVDDDDDARQLRQSQQEVVRILECAEADGRVFVLNEDVPHAWLFERCVCVLSHAGSGTVASAICAGMPQVCVPMLFDQFFFAEHVEYRGLGAQCRIRDLIGEAGAHGAALDACFRRALSNECRHETAAVSAQLRTQRAETARLCCAALDRARIEYAQYLHSIREHVAAASSTVQNDKTAHDDANATNYRSLISVSARRGLWPRLQPRGARCPWRFEFTRHPTEREERAAQASANTSGNDAGGDDVKTVSNVKRRRVTSTMRDTAVCASSESEMHFLVRELFGARVYAQPPLDWRRLGAQNCDAASGTTVPIVLDIGANVGLFVRFVDAEIGVRDRSVRVVAVEPVVQNYECLLENMRVANLLAPAAVCSRLSSIVTPAPSSPLTENCTSDVDQAFPAGVYPVRVGVGARATRLASFTYFPSMAGNSTMSALRGAKEDETRAAIGDSVAAAALLGGAQTCAAPVVTLDTLCTALEQCTITSSGNGAAASSSVGDLASPPTLDIALLKIDVEGAELDVLASLGARWWPRVAQVAIEVHCVGSRVDECVRILRERGGFTRVRVCQGAGDAAAVMVYAARE